MQTTIKKFSSSALFSFLLILPLIIMEVVNRRNFNDDFPYTLFFGLWLNLFFISFILLPIVLSKWNIKHDNTNPKLALIISIVLILIIAILSLLPSLGSESTEGLINTEYISVFGVRVSSQLIAFIILLLPVAAAIIASKPIITTLQAGGSLFAHPFQLIIVIVILLLLTIGAGSLIIDQWQCFIGVPICD